MMAPGLPEFAIRYKITSVTELSFTLSVFLLSFALAPLVIAPMSEMWGRTWVSNISFVQFLMSNSPPYRSYTLQICEPNKRLFQLASYILEYA